MIFKILKSIILLTVIGIISYSIVSHQKPSEEKLSSKKYENSAKLIMYKMKMKGGVLTIGAGKAIKENNILNLTDITANFTKKSKNIKIEAKKCNLIIDEKKAYLNESIIISSVNEGIKLTTNSAVIDWGNNSIFGNEKITGTKNGDRFSATGFSIKENGKIFLKYAKIIKVN